MCQSYCMLLCPIFLKGISTGSFELRADGTFHEWTIFNQHPAGPPKLQTLENTFMGLYVKRASGHTASYVLQTNPSDGRLPGVQSLMYQGEGGEWGTGERERDGDRERGSGGKESMCVCYVYVMCRCVCTHEFVHVLLYGVVCACVCVCVCVCMDLCVGVHEFVYGSV